MRRAWTDTHQASLPFELQFLVLVILCYRSASLPTDEDDSRHRVKSVKVDRLFPAERTCRMPALKSASVILSKSVRNTDVDIGLLAVIRFGREVGLQGVSLSIWQKKILILVL